MRHCSRVTYSAAHTGQDLDGTSQRFPKVSSVCPQPGGYVVPAFGDRQRQPTAVWLMAYLVQGAGGH